MKLTIVTTLAAATAAIITLTSNAGGPAHTGNGNKTGGPGSTGTCTSCHAGGATLANAGISINKKSTGQPAQGKYNAGALYTVQVSAMHPSLIRYGFQVMALDENDMQVGEFQNLGSDKHIKVVNNVKLVEHSTPIQQLGAVFATSFEWMAPPSGSGPVTFYGIINAVNGDGATAGDEVSSPIKFTVTEDAVSVSSVNADNDLSIYPNPAKEAVYIDIPANVNNGKVTIYSSAGVQMFTQQIVKGTLKLSILLADLPNGTYFIQLKGDNNVYNNLFIKQ